MDRLSRPVICNASLQVTKGSLAKTQEDFSSYAKKKNVVTIQNQKTWEIHAYNSLSYQMSSPHISKRSDYRFRFHVA